MNHEYTLDELKRMLAQAYEEIAKRDRRIALLEKALRDHGIPIPEGEMKPGQYGSIESLEEELVSV